MKKSKFNRLLERYLTGQVTEQERIRLEAWLEVMKRENSQGLTLSEDDEDRLFRKISATTGNTDEVIRPEGKQRWLRRGMVRMAACLLILIAASAIILYIQDIRKEQTVVSARDEKRMLDDGTIVWLSAGSDLQYREDSDGSRNATLTGEGLFEVAKDPARPFIITSGVAAIRVYGTSFRLRAIRDTVELNLLTGSVTLAIGDADPIAVRPDEKVFYSPATGLQRSVIDKSERAAMIAGTEYDMDFTNVPLSEVIRQLGEKFNKEILLDGDSGTCRITADLTDQSLESALLLLTEILDVGYQLDGARILVSGKGC